MITKFGIFKECASRALDNIFDLNRGKIKPNIHLLCISLINSFSNFSLVPRPFQTRQSIDSPNFGSIHPTQYKTNLYKICK